MNKETVKTNFKSILELKKEKTDIELDMLVLEQDIAKDYVDAMGWKKKDGSPDNAKCKMGVLKTLLKCHDIENVKNNIIEQYEAYTAMEKALKNNDIDKNRMEQWRDKADAIKELKKDIKAFGVEVIEKEEMEELQLKAVEKWSDIKAKELKKEKVAELKDSNTTEKPVDEEFALIFEEVGDIVKNIS